MRVLSLFAACSLIPAVLASAGSSATAGVEAFVKRRLPKHTKDFEFQLTHAPTTPNLTRSDDDSETYTVSSTKDGKILVKGSTVSALMTGYVNCTGCGVLERVLTK